MNSSQAFRKLIKGDCIPIVGAYDGLVARSIAQNGQPIKLFIISIINSFINRLQMLLCFRIFY